MAPILQSIGKKQRLHMTEIVKNNSAIKLDLLEGNVVQINQKVEW